MTANGTGKTELKIKMTNGDDLTVTFEGHSHGSSIIWAIRQLQDEKLINQIFTGCIQQGDFSVLEFVPRANAIEFLQENNLLPAGVNPDTLGPRPWESIVFPSEFDGSAVQVIEPDTDFGGLPRATF
jgi:hypothetical protein